MVITSPEQFDPSQSNYQFYWSFLEATVSRVFAEDVDLVRRYRDSLTSSGEMLLALHDEPLDIAARLSDVEVTEEHSKKYDALLHQFNVRRTWIERRFPYTSDPITLEELDQRFGELGYVRDPAKLKGIFYQWRSKEREFEGQFLPHLLNLTDPYFWNEKHDTLVYDRVFVYEFLTRSFADTEIGIQMRRIFFEVLIGFGGRPVY